MSAVDRAALALTGAQIETVLRIVDAAAPGTRVSVFGSRATGRCRPFSDLDLLLERARSLTWRERADLRDAFEASDLPFLVDVVEAAELAPGYQGRVAAELVALPPA